MILAALLLAWVGLILRSEFMFHILSNLSLSQNLFYTTKQKTRFMGGFSGGLSLLSLAAGADLLLSDFGGLTLDGHSQILPPLVFHLKHHSATFYESAFRHHHTATYWSRTSDNRGRNPMLYPSELKSLCSDWLRQSGGQLAINPCHRILWRVHDGTRIANSAVVMPIAMKFYCLSIHHTESGWTRYQLADLCACRFCQPLSRVHMPSVNALCAYPTGLLAQPPMPEPPSTICAVRFLQRRRFCVVPALNRHRTVLQPQLPLAFSEVSATSVLVMRCQ